MDADQAAPALQSVQLLEQAARRNSADCAQRRVHESVARKSDSRAVSAGPTSLPLYLLFSFYILSLFFFFLFFYLFIFFKKLFSKTKSTFYYLFYLFTFFLFSFVRDQVCITCCCEFLVRSGFLSVWHLHSVSLLHGHVVHSSHSAEELDSRFASEWETNRLPLS